MYTPCVPPTRKTTHGEKNSADASRSGSLQHAWRNIEEAVGTIGHVDLFCDYDGVLAPIAPRPQDARLNKNTLHLLRRLSHHNSLHMSIVSGRSLADIRMRVGVPGITYAGNHGLEIDGPGIQQVQQIPSRMHDAMRTLAATLQRAMRPYLGVIVEDKALVIAVHFRMAEPGQIPLILSEFSALVADRNVDHLLRVSEGKSVVEVRPNVDWDKGRAVNFLLEKRHGTDWLRQTLPVYLGDDETDEDAFRALMDYGIAIRVGDPSSAKTAARCALQDTDEVAVFLDRLLSSLPGV